MMTVVALKKNFVIVEVAGASGNKRSLLQN